MSILKVGDLSDLHNNNHLVIIIIWSVRNNII